jgi:hypothetical protein
MITNDTKQKCEQHFLQHGWNDKDREIVALREATTDSELFDALYEIALTIGNNKGYGDEGTYEVLEEILTTLDLQHLSEL